MTTKKYQLKITIYGYNVDTIEEATRMVLEKISQLKLAFSLVPPFVKRKTVTVPISPHKHKDSQEKFEQETHRRWIFINHISPAELDALEKLKIPTTAHLKTQSFF